MTKLVKAKAGQPLIKTPQELVHIKHKITLRQYKYWLLMLRAYREAYEANEQPGEHEFYRLPIATLEKWIGYELVRAELRHDLEAIRREPIIYNVLGKDGKKLLRGAGFISEWEISANWIGFKLPGFLRKSIEQLDLKTSIFQKINWAVFNSFTGKYEAILYKLCRDYVGVKRTPVISIQDYREYMGLKESEYPVFKDLNKFVITAPLKRINDSIASDITVESVFTKEGRRIVAVQFLVTMKQQAMLELGDDPAFQLARVPISLVQQNEYLALRDAALVELSIERANAYADEQEAAGKPVANLGALYRTAIEENWGLEYQKRRAREQEQAAKLVAQRQAKTAETKKHRLKELQEEFGRHTVAIALKSLTDSDRRARALAYVAGAGQGRATSFNGDTGTFGDKLEAAQFNIWLRSTLAPDFDEKAFSTWLQTEKGIEPKKLDAS